jgi:drug/metabolite transporter (DMT)-like permease
MWLLWALLTTVLWGVWGALIELPEKAGFPATLGYAVWSLTMVPCAVFALARARWHLDRDRRSLLAGMTAGLLGAGGQVLLFQALRTGPAYLVFPIVSLYPVISVVLSVLLLHERARRRNWLGIVLAFPAIVMLSYQPAAGDLSGRIGWLLLAFVVFAFWGVQAFVIKAATGSMQAESIFVYMTAGGLLLAPAAVSMTDFSTPVTWSFRGPGAAALIQVMNSIGALTLVYALRSGPAILVVPMTALAPVLTVILSLMIYGVVPNAIVTAGLVVATAAIYLMAE